MHQWVFQPQLPEVSECVKYVHDWVAILLWLFGFLYFLLLFFPLLSITESFIINCMMGFSYDMCLAVMAVFWMNDIWSDYIVREHLSNIYFIPSGNKPQGHGFQDPLYFLYFFKSKVCSPHSDFLHKSVCACENQLSSNCSNFSWIIKCKCIHEHSHVWNASADDWTLSCAAVFDGLLCSTGKLGSWRWNTHQKESLFLLYIVVEYLAMDFFSISLHILQYPFFPSACKKILMIFILPDIYP